MTQEAYCNYEVSKLLKEKGCNYPNQGMIAVHNSDGTHEIRNVCSQAVAMRWLREVHNIHISPFQGAFHQERPNGTYHQWCCDIIGINNRTFVVDGRSGVPHIGERTFLDNGYAPYHDTYESCVDECLKYTLEHLI